MGEILRPLQGETLWHTATMECKRCDKVTVHNVALIRRVKGGLKVKAICTAKMKVRHKHPTNWKKTYTEVRDCLSVRKLVITYEQWTELVHGQWNIGGAHG